MKSKIKTVVKENKYIFLTFVISLVIISIIYALNKVAPFGNNSLLTIDFYHQYGPMLNELVNRIDEGKSFLYSFNTGGGIPFYRNFLNYLSSPFNAFLLLFKRENIVMAFSVVIAIKAVVAATFMSYFLKKAFKKDNILIIVFGILYAFSGYFCSYYWNIMWLDGMVFLPIITLGIIRLIDYEKPLLYMFSLSIMLFANYFIGYMICIFSCLFFIGYFIYKRDFEIKNILKKVFLFSFFSILSAGLVSFALIPLYCSLSSISATSDAFPEFSFSFNILKFFFNHITGVSQTTFASDIMPLPNVYVGIITLFALITLFLNSKIKLRVKMLSFLAIFIFIMSFEVSGLNFIWHAFHIPNDLPWRYSFIYVFVIATLGYYSLSRIKDLKLFVSYCVFGFLCLFLFMSQKMNFENITNQKVITCFILLICYIILFIMFSSEKIPKIIVNLMLIIVVSLEVIYGIDSNWSIDHDISAFMSDKNSYKKLIKSARLNDNGLYRIEKTNSLTLNDGSWYDYYGMSTFSSMAYEDVAKAQRKLGMSGNNINSYYYQNYQTPVYNTMFNIKYLIGNYIENDYYTPIDSMDSYNLIGYNYSSSIGFLVDESIKNTRLISDDPFYNQSKFVNLLVPKKEVYKPVLVEKINQGKITSSSNGNYFITTDEVSNKVEVILNNEKNQNIYLYINGMNVSSFFVNGLYHSVSSDEFYIVDIGKVKEGKVSLEINLKEPNSNFNLYAYSLDEATFEAFYEKINEGILNVESYSETIINSNINALKDGTVFTSLAYDEGFEVFVDDKKINTFKVLDGYLGFDLKKGYHDIKIKYYPKGLRLGLLITFMSFLAIILYILFGNSEKKAKR